MSISRKWHAKQDTVSVKKLTPAEMLKNEFIARKKAMIDIRRKESKLSNQTTMTIRLFPNNFLPHMKPCGGADSFTSEIDTLCVNPSQHPFLIFSRSAGALKFSYHRSHEGRFGIPAIRRSPSPDTNLDPAVVDVYL